MTSLQSAMKKRKSAAVDGESLVASPSRSPGRRISGRSTKDGTCNSAFRSACANALASSLQQINKWVSDVIAAADIPKDNDDRVTLANKTDGGTFKDRPTFAYADLSCEYIRLVQNVKRSYGCSVPSSNSYPAIELLSGFEIVAMGSDDSNQIGAPTVKKTRNNNKENQDVEFESDSDDEEKQTVVAPFLKRGFPVASNSFRFISAGGMHSVVLTIDGDAYTWGSADDGALGRDFDNGAPPEESPGIVSGFTSSNGENEDNTIIQVAAGDTHILFLTLAGNVYQCGAYKDMDSGKFRDEYNGSVKGFNPKPVHVHQIKRRVKGIYTRAAYNVALLEDDSIVTWGFGNKGELARTANMTNKTMPDGTYDLTKSFFYDLETGEPKVDIVKKHFLTPLPPIWADANIRPKKVVISVATGAYHLVVAAREPSDLTSILYTSGLNNYGQLGHGDIYVDRHELTPVEALRDKDIARVAAGEHHSLALNLSGTELYSFGRADYGQLGLGERDAGAAVLTPTLVKFPPVPGSIPPQHQILIDITAGDRQSHAMTIENDVYTWGFNEVGTTGHPDDGKDIYIPTLLDVEAHIKTNREPYARVYGVAGGGQHTLMLMKRFRQASTEGSTKEINAADEE